MAKIQVKQTKISSRYQTVIPVFIRKALGLKQGDKILWIVDKSNGKVEVNLESGQKNWGNYLSGLGSSLWTEDKNNVKEKANE